MNKNANPANSKSKRQKIDLYSKNREFLKIKAKNNNTEIDLDPKVMYLKAKQDPPVFSKRIFFLGNNLFYVISIKKILII